MSFGYLEPLPSYLEERPYYIYDDVPQGTIKGNLKFCYGPEQHVEDVRGSAEVFDMDVQGFTFKRDAHPIHIDWNSQRDIETNYISSVKAVVMHALGEPDCRCEFFDWRVSYS